MVFNLKSLFLLSIFRALSVLNEMLWIQVQHRSSPCFGSLGAGESNMLLQDLPGKHLGALSKYHSISEVRSLGTNSHVGLWMARRAQGIKDCIPCLVLVHWRDAVPKQCISVCLHSYQLQLLSPASSPAWAMLLPKGQWAEPNV